MSVASASTSERRSLPGMDGATDGKGESREGFGRGARTPVVAPRGSLGCITPWEREFKLSFAGMVERAA